MRPSGQELAGGADDFRTLAGDTQSGPLYLTKSRRRQALGRAGAFTHGTQKQLLNVRDPNGAANDPRRQHAQLTSLSGVIEDELIEPLATLDDFTLGCVGGRHMHVCTANQCAELVGNISR